MENTCEKFNGEEYGLKNLGNIYHNLSNPKLYEEVVRRGEGLLTHLGPIVVRTGNYTGRTPRDKFIVKEESSQENIWWGKENKPFSEDKFNSLFNRLMAYLQSKDIFVQDCYVGADQKYKIPIRVITEFAWHNLFARNVFIQIRNKNEVFHRP